MNYSFMNDVCMETPLSMIVSIGEIKHAGTAKCLPTVTGVFVTLSLKALLL